MVWFLYIAHCADGSLYTGITIDVHRRILQHNSGKGAKSIVKSKRPVALVYTEKFGDKYLAARRENAIKNWKRKYKLKLINSQKMKGFTQ